MTTATIHKFRARIKPQSLIEAPVDTRTPLMKRLDDIQARSERPRVQAVPEHRDPYKWRRKARAAGVIKGTCPKCLGKGWVLSHKYADWDDFMDCPECGPDYDVMGQVPDAGDESWEVPF